MAFKARGELGGERNVVLLQTYISELAAQGRGVPVRAGRPNLSVIAEACGFDRGVFYQNSTAKSLLDAAVAELGFATSSAKSTDAYDEARLKDESKSLDNRRLKALEEENLYLRAENSQLRAENIRFRALQQLMANTGRMP